MKNFLLITILISTLFGCDVDNSSTTEKDNTLPTKDVHKLELFRQEIESSNPRWKNSTLDKEELADTVKTKFINLVNSGGLENSKFMLTSISSYSKDKAAIHFSYGNSILSEYRVHVDFYSIVPKNMIRGLSEDSLYVFKISKLKKNLNYGENKKYSYRMVYSPFINISDGNLNTIGYNKDESPVMDISLGMWLVNVDSIK